jgi:glutamate-ammonia-ligase adenylyltransferase
MLAAARANAVEPPRSAADYRAALAATLPPDNDEDALRAELRRFRYRELARIAWRDLVGLAPLDTVLAELSALADALVGTAADRLQARLAARFGNPRDEQGNPVRLLVLAMGKLGGQELNFSSDIDLVFLYRAAGETCGAPRALANQEFFDRLGRKLIPLLNDTTPDGFVYRVDMRLRPFGESGALTTSFAALEHYYQVHGRDWERYALIKARAITADARDLQALDAITRPFVFRRYLDFGALQALREMKALINAEVTRYGLEDDIKRGPGGIREVEFIGQVFQLIRGGREPRLRQRGIIPVLQACADLGLMAADEVARSTAAYRYLRIVEHRLQQVDDAQTQELPACAAARARLAYALGCHDWPAFGRVLEGHRAQIRQSFAALLKPGAEQAPEPADAELAWRLADDDPGRTREILARAGYTDLAQAATVLAQLKDGRFLGRLSVAARARLDRLMPELVAACARLPHGAETLARLADFVRAVARRSVYLALLAENRDALQRLVSLCHSSVWVARELTASPVLLDELLDDRLLYSPLVRAGLETALDEALENSCDEGLERVMDALRVVKHQQVLRVAASDLMAGFPIAEVSNHLTWIAEVLIDRAHALAWRELVTKHGRPRHRDGSALGFAIIAYGKLGGLELGYGSDLDLVFVHDANDTPDLTDGARPIAADLFFTRLAQRVIHLLATRTGAGVAYELDVRLRPSGAAGLLVTSTAAFASYQQQEAWTWEHQALVRARAVAGHPVTCARFEAIRRQVLRQAREPQMLLAQIAQMRARMRRELDRSDAASFDLKQGNGGITDIEFVVQYAVLRWASRFPVLCAYTDNLRLLDLIADLGLIPRADSDSLREAYFTYRTEVHHCALREIDGMVEHTRFAAERRVVAAVWSRVMRHSIG